MTFWVGLSGGIGSGKSTVAHEFALLGVPILDADYFAHQLTKPNGRALASIRAQWGNVVFRSDQTLDRERLRQLVFKQPQQKAILEALLHPLIWQALKTAQEHTDHCHHYGIIEIPLLLEQPVFQALVQQILIVDAPESVRIERTQQRSALSEDTIRAIIAQQANTAARRSLANQIIHNDGSLSYLQQQVRRLHHFYQALNLP